MIGPVVANVIATGVWLGLGLAKSPDYFWLAALNGGLAAFMVWAWRVRP